jgi:hypothetical protein
MARPEGFEPPTPWFEAPKGYKQQQTAVADNNEFNELAFFPCCELPPFIAVICGEVCRLRGADGTPRNIAND